MVDVLTPEQRHINMSNIRGKDTKPELRLRALVRSLGYKHQANVADLPGKPDLVFKGSRKIIFVHGCYWHSHACKYGEVYPKTNAKFWKSKRAENVRRDRAALRKLRKSGWNVLVVWECWLRKPEWLTKKLIGFMND